MNAKLKCGNRNLHRKFPTMFYVSQRTVTVVLNTVQPYLSAVLLTKEKSFFSAKVVLLN
jgi:hypothetical protein